MHLLYFPFFQIVIKAELPPGLIASLILALILTLVKKGDEKNKKNNKEVEYIFYSNRHRLTKDHLMIAYIRLAALLIDDDRSEAGKKVIYMNKYFIRYFPENQVHFSDTFSHSLYHKVKLSSVGTWLNRKLPAKKDRLQIMYFLTGVTKIDGFVNSKELKTLQTIANLLEISPKEFRTILGIYNQQENSNKKNKIPTKSKRIVACEILGVSDFAKMDEIKKAYRKLVKIHHPDRFYNDSIEQQDIAEERFIAIQKAYETLEKTF